MKISQFKKEKELKDRIAVRRAFLLVPFVEHVDRLSGLNEVFLNLT